MEEALRPLSDVPAINRFLSYCRVRTIPGKTVLIHAGEREHCSKALHVRPGLDTGAEDHES